MTSHFLLTSVSFGEMTVVRRIILGAQRFLYCEMAQCVKGCVLVYRANLTVGLGYFIHIEGLFVGGGI